MKNELRFLMYQGRFCKQKKARTAPGLG